jgi:hypothetical protein
LLPDDAVGPSCPPDRRGPVSSRVLAVVVGGLVLVDGVTSSMAGTDLAGEGRATSAASTPRLTATAARVAITRSRFMRPMMPAHSETTMIGP